MISEKVLAEWIKKQASKLKDKNTIYANEFLYLVANSLDRQEFFHNIPKATLDITRDDKFKLFNIDSE